MLESGVDRIITQVVDPKMNHTFRPQIETAIHDFLSGDRKDENSTSGPSEQAETQEPPSGSGPKTPWDFIFIPDIQLKDIRILEIAIKICIFLLQAHVLGSLHSVAYLFEGATEKARAWGYCKITWKVRSVGWTIGHFIGCICCTQPLRGKVDDMQQCTGRIHLQHYFNVVEHLAGFLPMGFRVFLGGLRPMLKYTYLVLH